MHFKFIMLFGAKKIAYMNLQNQEALLSLNKLKNLKKTFLVDNFRRNDYQCSTYRV